MKWLLPPVMYLLCVLGMVLTRGLVAIELPAMPRWIGPALLVLGLLFPLSGGVMFLRRRINIKTFDPPGGLVTSGMFRFSRNPMYLGFTLSLCGAALWVGKLTSLLFVLVFWIAANWWYIPFEERLMRQRFGDDYEWYTRRVRRWL